MTSGIISLSREVRLCREREVKAASCSVLPFALGDEPLMARSLVTFRLLSLSLTIRSRWRILTRVRHHNGSHCTKTVLSEFRRRLGQEIIGEGCEEHRPSAKEHGMNCPPCAWGPSREQTKKRARGSRTLRCSTCKQTFNERRGTPFNSLQYPTDIVLLVVVWRLRYKLRLRDLAEMFLQRGLVLT